MSISKENLEIRNKILEFERKIEEMHLAFQKYTKGIEARMPDWERFQQELLQFSKRKIYDLVLSKQLDRVLYKFQNRKSIWLRLVDEFQHARKNKDPLSIVPEGKNVTTGR
jgi:hypothetical protein